MNKILLIILVISLFIIGNNYYTNGVKNIKEKIFTHESEILKHNYQRRLQRKKERITTLAYILSNDKKISYALLNPKNTSLNLNNIIDGISKYDRFKDIWIQVIDINGNSFYRSWTHKKGDNLLSVRPELNSILKTHKPISSITTGKYDITIKSMFPVYKESHFVGIIELIAHLDSIATRLQENNINSVVIVNKEHTQFITQPFSKMYVDGYYLSSLNAQENFLENLHTIGIKKLFHLKNYLIFKQNLIASYPIKDINNEIMSYAIFSKELSTLDMSSLENFKGKFYKKIVFILIGFMLLTFLFFNRRYVLKLNNEVRKKTREINNQKEELELFLKIYDKNVIFSTTDLQGRITHASEAFCKISGYTEAELLGKNHNIVRHEEMPSSMFKTLWDELKQEKIVNIELKNRKKAGGFYWVKAEVAPQYDKNKKLIGYMAIREDITATKEIESIQKEIIFLMGSIGESRSKETGNHVRRVAEYSRLLANLLGLSEAESEMIYEASPMHDIGKIAIPDAILQKPGKLTKEEWVIMQTHSQKGYEILKSSQRPLLKTAAVIAKEHHERYDGKGYPQNIKGKDINLYARITAIADVFDALGSDRCYKKAWDDEKIYTLFKEERGKQFDPKLIDLFFAHIDEFLLLREKFKD